MYDGDVENKGTTRSNVDSKVLREGRAMNILLLWKKKPKKNKEEMCTWLLQEHMHIMKHEWLNQVHIFI